LKFNLVDFAGFSIVFLLFLSISNCLFNFILKSLDVFFDSVEC
jgi:hypothetical protein